jgi:hypothetical protein
MTKREDIFFVVGVGEAMFLNLSGDLWWVAVVKSLDMLLAMVASLQEESAEESVNFGLL